MGVPPIYKEHLQINKKNTIGKKTSKRYMNRCYTKKETHVANKVMKKYLSFLSSLRNEYARSQ